jgi:ribonuclease R
LSQSANKVNFKQIGAKLELDDTESRNQIIKDLKILASKIRLRVNQVIFNKSC